LPAFSKWEFAKRNCKTLKLFYCSHSRKWETVKVEQVVDLKISARTRKFQWIKIRLGEISLITWNLK